VNPQAADGRHVTAEARQNADDGRLSPGVLGTSSIVFMVMAASAPLAVVVAMLPLAFAFGNGAGVPGTWLLATVAMLLFAIGYVRIIPHVKNAGAFYAYICASIGRTPGLAAAYVASLSYFALSCSTLAALAFFSADFVQRIAGVDIPWQLWAGGYIALLIYLANHRITLAATVLAFALVAEILVVLALCAAIFWQRGPAAFDPGDLMPATVLSPGLGIALMYGFNSIIGLEGTAIYQEEARDRKRTVPRATYISVIVVGLFYFVTAWCLSTSVGSANVASIALADPGHFVTDRANEHLGWVGSVSFSVLVLTSGFAATLGLFNNSTRYVYALARDGVLPRRFSRTHPKYHSPHVAGTALGVLLIAVMGAAALLDLHPLLNISTSLVGLGSVGLMALLATTALVVPVYFARRRDFGLAKTVAPALGGLAIGWATWLAVSNYSALTGVDSPIINRLPWLLVAAAGAGFVQASWLKAGRPDIYAWIGASRIEEDATPAG
jgi:amino acid transporter